MKIQIEIRHKNSFNLDKTEIKKAVKAVLKADGKKVSTPYEIAVVFVEKDEIREINRQYRDIDRATDVISFSFLEGEGALFAPLLLGDLFICPDVVHSNSVRFNTSFEKELTFVVVHGTLHLLGYDHLKRGEREKMRIMEQNIMKSLFEEWEGRVEK
ncbi:MAG: rRNA maturation RNase YbeY [bacterium]